MTEIAVQRTELSDQMDFARTVVMQPERGAQSILPKEYQNNPANVLIAVGLGSSMGLSPAESLYRITVIQGKPTASAELIAANVRKAGHKLRVRGDEKSCTATIVRADDPDYEFTVTRDLEWAKAMGLTGKDNYKKQPGTMLQWRAITAVARLACPEALYGVVYSSDEIVDERPTQAERPGGGGLGAALAAQGVTDDPGPVAINDEQTGNTITPASPGSITKAQLTTLQISLKEAGITNRDDGLDYYEATVGRRVGSSKELSQNEASQVIDALKQVAEADVHDAEIVDEPALDWPEVAPVGGDRA